MPLPKYYSSHNGELIKNSSIDTERITRTIRFFYPKASYKFQIKFTMERRYCISVVNTLRSYWLGLRMSLPIFLAVEVED